MSTTANVRVGVGVLVRDPKNPNKVFAGLRRNSHGAGTLALPGGHLEMYETWEECAIREVMEETGILISQVQHAHVTNDIMKDQGKHYVTIFMVAECMMGYKPENLEPHKCEGWSSYSWDELCRFAKNSKDNGGDNKDPILFGPLLQLVEDKPQLVVDYMSDPLWSNPDKALAIAEGRERGLDGEYTRSVE